MLEGKKKTNEREENYILESRATKKAGEGQGVIAPTVLAKYESFATQEVGEPTSRRATYHAPPEANLPVIPYI